MHPPPPVQNPTYGPAYERERERERESILALSCVRLTSENIRKRAFDFVNTRLSLAPQNSLFTNEKKVLPLLTHGWKF